MDLINEKEKIVEDVQGVLQKVECIISGRIYGSWLYNEKSVDMDIALMIRSDDGLISPEDYSRLHFLRNFLCSKTSQDIDLVPHTEDEYLDNRSPLWYPRYNPSLVFGKDLKNEFKITPISRNDEFFSFADLTAYVLHDNRTICRRQLIRSLNEEEGRIFTSKLLHGPGNALTYLSCKNKEEYKVPPSNLEACFEEFDRIYSVDSTPAFQFLRQCKEKIDRTTAQLLMNWYERLFYIVLSDTGSKKKYQDICFMLNKQIY